MLRYLLLLSFLIVLKPCQAQYFDTLHIHYDIGVASLQQKDKATLDSLVKKIGNRKMLVYSYADYLGSERPNQRLSDNRANEVKNYLLKKDVSPEQIMQCAGLGQAGNGEGGRGNVIYRRTDIFIRKQIPVSAPIAVANNGPLESSFPASAAGTKGDSSYTTGQIQPVRSEKPDGIIHQLHFLSGRSNVHSCCAPVLNKLYYTMQQHPKIRVKLEGHVCCSIYPDGYVKGTPNWELSVTRARWVYQYLIGRGIAADRLEYEGYGHTRPIRDREKNAVEGSLNMRVEVRVLNIESL
jgi:outer membrane protein OmpA-like peptidoglycan-associated protein